MMEIVAEICPRCGQGKVLRATVRKTAKTLFVCEECDATWFSKSDIGKSEFCDLGTYLKQQGLSPLWDELIL